MADVKPRVAITYCTQCKWMLRAAYYAQELLSTFSDVLGEVALVPSTGGTFTVYATYKSPSGIEVSTTADDQLQQTESRLWDRKVDGGFPEAKVLKQRLRDCIQPERSLGHSDAKTGPGAETAMHDQAGPVEAAQGQCTDC